MSASCECGAGGPLRWSSGGPGLCVVECGGDNDSARMVFLDTRVIDGSRNHFRVYSSYVDYVLCPTRFTRRLRTRFQRSDARFRGRSNGLSTDWRRRSGLDVIIYLGSSSLCRMFDHRYFWRVESSTFTSRRSSDSSFVVNPSTSRAGVCVPSAPPLALLGKSYSA